MSNFWKDLEKPIKVLAPMAGYTDAAFRLLCHRFGADVVMTELISADAIFHQAKNWFKVPSTPEVMRHYHLRGDKTCRGEVIWQSKKGKDETLEMLKFDERERPIIIQLFGKYPEKFAFAAKWITENLKPDGIDINMGCPAKKVVKSGHGAALMKNPDLAVTIIKAVKNNTDLPVSVKTRLGWENSNEILEFAPKLAAAGIDAIIIHARTYKQGFSGQADWGNIYKVKSMLPELCVIGNGDIKTISNIETRISQQTQNSNLYRPYTPPKLGGEGGGISDLVRQPADWISPLDGVAIGRAAFGKPWIFRDDSNLKSQISKLRNDSDLEESISVSELKETILKHANLVYAAKGNYGLIEFRKHLLAYLKGNPRAKELRREAVAISSISDIKRIVEKISEA